MPAGPRAGRGGHRPQPASCRVIRRFAAIAPKRIHAVTCLAQSRRTLAPWMPRPRIRPKSTSPWGRGGRACWGANVARLRKRAKINKKTFCLMVGIGRPFLNRIESGQANPRLSVLESLAEALETTPQDLLTPPFEPFALSSRRGAPGRGHPALASVALHVGAAAQGGAQRPGSTSRPGTTLPPALAPRPARLPPRASARQKSSQRDALPGRVPRASDHALSTWHSPSL